MLSWLVEQGHRFPYFAVVSVGFAVVLLGYAVARRSRREMLISGLTYTTALPLYLPFESIYWTPPRIGGWILGIEDVLCLFSLGSLVWLAATFPLRGRVHTRPRLGVFIRRFVSVGAAGSAFFTALWIVGCDPLWASVSAQVFIAVIMLFVRTDLWPLVVSGVAFYSPYYCAILGLASWVWPEHSGMWTFAQTPAVTTLGFPIAETIWVTTFAASWPILMAHALDTQITPKEDPGGGRDGFFN